MITGPERALAAQAKAHAHAREQGVLPWLYALARAVLAALLRLWFLVRVSGADHVPAQGPVIIAPNHKSFLDAFFVGIATTRHVRYMAKAELFKGPLAWLLVRLGAFPVRRGEADDQALETARRVLCQGGVVVVFPEGTRVEEPHVLGSPHHGAGRIALETSAPIVPVAIAGTSHLWLGPLPKPRLIQLAFLAPIDVANHLAASDKLSTLIDDEVWPAVQRAYSRLLTTPGPILTALGAIGIGRGLITRRERRMQGKVQVRGVIEPRRLRQRQARQRLLRGSRPRRR